MKIEQEVVGMKEKLVGNERTRSGDFARSEINERIKFPFWMKIDTKTWCRREKKKMYMIANGIDGDMCRKNNLM